jgi:hypothetical protein
MVIIHECKSEAWVLQLAINTKVVNCPLAWISSLHHKKSLEHTDESLQDSRQNEVVRGKEIHISGAEGLYEVSEIQRTVQRYIKRALTHPKGIADNIAVTIEEIRQRVHFISVAFIVFIGIWFTGFDRVHWFLYVPVLHWLLRG